MGSSSVAEAPLLPRSMAQQYSIDHRNSLLSRNICRPSAAAWLSSTLPTGHRSTLPSHSIHTVTLPPWPAVAWLSSTLLVAAVPYCHTVFTSKSTPFSTPQHGSEVLYRSPQYPTATPITNQQNHPPLPHVLRPTAPAGGIVDVEHVLRRLRPQFAALEVNE